MPGTIRSAQFAGVWYPDTLEEAKSFIEPSENPVKARAVVVPHAGWLYSGKVAGAVYGRLQPPDVAIVIGPNHTGKGQSSISLFPSGFWDFPESRVEVAEDVSRELLKYSEFLSVDLDAHAREHCLEVQIPFLLLLNPKIRIVPIVMKEHEPEIFRDLGRCLSATVRKFSEISILLVATTDMTHYDSRQQATQKDSAAIDRMTAVDAEGFRSVVDTMGITLCGLGPVASVLLAARSLGATTGELVRYATSGDITKDDDSVVGYAGVIVE